MSQQDVPQIKRFFDQCVFGFIYYDVQAAIDGKANYLAALGLVAYTEFMGGLVNGTLGQTSKSRARFYAFWDRMGEEYRALRGIREIVKIYSHVRCGLAHSYFIDRDSTVRMSIGEGYGLRCGIEVHYSPDEKVVFIVERYFQDFKTACAEFYEELVEQKDPGLLQRFPKAVGGQWYFNELVAGVNGIE